jgi:hypothetical protein
MAGLAGTQANARAAMEAAANLANQFGARAAELKKAEMAAKLAKEKLAVVDKAHKGGGIDDAEKKQQTKRVLDEMNASDVMPLTTEDVTSIADLADRNQANVSWENMLGEKLNVEGRSSPEVGIIPASTLFGPTLPPLQWPPDATQEPNDLIKGFIESVNELGRDIGAYLEESNPKNKYIPGFVTALETEGGREFIAESILAINAIVAADVAKLMVALLSVARGDQQMCIPRVARMMANRAGMLLAWVDFAIKQKSQDELEQIKLHKAQWDEMQTIINAASVFIENPFLSFLTAEFIARLAPDFIEKLDSVRQDFRILRDSYRQLGRNTFINILTQEAQRTGKNTAGLEEIVEIYGEWVLGGWDKELRFLGSSPTIIEI